MKNKFRAIRSRETQAAHVEVFIVDDEETGFDTVRAFADFAAAENRRRKHRGKAPMSFQVTSYLRTPRV